MERIDSAGRSIYSPSSKNKKKVKKKMSERLSFSSLVDDEWRADTANIAISELGVTSNSSLEAMLDAIHSFGDEVRENAGRETVGRYRQAVRAFMKYVLSSALTVDVKSSSPNILRQKKFTLVKIIDQKLERLASGVLTNQHDALEILSRIGEINGLLVDLIS